MKKNEWGQIVESDEELREDDAPTSYIRMMVPVSKITVDPRVQRSTLNVGKVNKILREFSESALGVVTLSDRGLDELVALDGQHRCEVVRRLTDNTGLIDANVFKGLTLAQEARMFLDLNYANQPTLFDKYRVGVTGGDIEFSDIDNIVHRAGFTVGSDGANGTIAAIAALRRVYALDYPTIPDDEQDQYPNILGLALTLIFDAWGLDEDALKGAPIEAIGRMIRNYSNLDLDRLLDAMRRFTPTSLLAQAKGYATQRGIRQWQAYGQLLVDAYNKNLGVNSRIKLTNFANR